MAETKRSTPKWLFIVIPLAVIILGAVLLFVFRESLPFDLPLPAAFQPTSTYTPEPTMTPSLAASATATQAPTRTATEELPTPTATLSPTSTKKLTATPFPTSTHTPTLEGTQITLTPTRTVPWYYRRITFTPTRSRTTAPSKTPTITATPTPRDHELRIDSPGPMSKVVSPLLYDTYVAPGADGKAYVRLIGEDGRVIATDTIYGDYGRHFRVQRYLDFSIPGVGELARLEIHVVDRYDRTYDLAVVMNDSPIPAYTRHWDNDNANYRDANGLIADWQVIPTTVYERPESP